MRCHSALWYVDLGGTLNEASRTSVPDGARLGNGFVAWTNSDGLTVRTLGGGHETRVYGPVRQIGPGHDFAVDDDGTGVVFVGPTRQVRRVDASWAVPTSLPAPVAPDTLAPRVGLTTPLAARVVGGGARVTLTWTASDDPAPGKKVTGLRSTDVRWSQQGSASWVYPPTWQSSSGPSVTVYDVIDGGTGRCYSARSRDYSDNVGEGSTPACQYVDDAPSASDREGGSPEFVPWTKGHLVYSWSSSSPDALSYDLESRALRRDDPFRTGPT